MVDLRALEKQFLSAHLKTGGTAVDFTMGNGHDTEFISKAVGESGHVYAFDIQQQAIDSTSKLLSGSGCPSNYTLILDSHANVKNYVSSKICAGVFNLGYLPGGNKAITTMRTSTIPAVDAAVELLDDDGIVLIAIYPGHNEGKLEGELLSEHFCGLDRHMYCVSRFQLLNSPTSPYFISVEKK